VLPSFLSAPGTGLLEPVYIPAPSGIVDASFLTTDFKLGAVFTGGAFLLSQTQVTSTGLACA
jgi:hypothetical protein